MKSILAKLKQRLLELITGEDYKVISNGKLFVIESGTDGAGKATQTLKLYEALVALGFKVKRITFPDYESDSSALVKMYLKGEFGTNPDDVNAYVASEFYAIDRFASFKTKWGKDYNDGVIILADRYSSSNAVHQAVKIKDSRKKRKFLKWLWNLEHVKNKIPVATETLFLDLSPEVSEKLRENRNNKFTGEKEKDIHESDTNYLKNCYENALYISKKYNWKNIKCDENGSIKDVETIHREILQHVLGLLNN